MENVMLNFTHFKTLVFFFYIGQCVYKKKTAGVLMMVILCFLSPERREYFDCQKKWSATETEHGSRSFYSGSRWVTS